MIVFINCFEAMNIGMRMLAHMAKNKGFNVHIIIMRDYYNAQSYTDWNSSIDIKEDTRACITNSALKCYSPEEYSLSNKELELLQEKLQELKPEMVCISSRGTNNEIMPSLMASIKKACNVPIVCGGFGPSYDAKFYLENGADLVLRGEGEISLLALLDNHKNNKPLHDAPNTSWLENGELKQNRMAPPLPDFSSNPMPLTGDEYISYIHDDICEERDPAYTNLARGAYAIVVGRGCIGTCSYCAAPLLREFYMEEGYTLKKQRRRPYSQVLSEIEEAKKHDIKKVNIVDDYFVDTTENLISFLKEYKERINLPFRANFHSSQLFRSTELRKAVIEAGCYDCTIGFQSGSEDIARNIFDRPHPFNELREIGNVFYNNFISVQYHFISGTTLNTEEEFKDKCKLIASLPFDPLNQSRTLILDYRFFPQALSKLTKEFGKTLKHLPFETYLNLAVRAQLRQFLPEQKCLEVEDRAKKEKDANIFLLEESANIRKRLQKEKIEELAKLYETKDILIMGEASTAFKSVENLFNKVNILASVGFPNVEHKDSNRIDPKNAHKEFNSDIPLFIFGSKALPFANKMRIYGFKNTIHTITNDIDLA